MPTPVQFANGPLPQSANTSLTSTIPSSGGGTVTVGSATYLPTVGPFLIVVDNERIEIDSISGTTLTFLASGRGLEGTAAAAHASGASVYQVLSVATLARHIDDRAAKGTVDKAFSATDVTLSTTAGTFSDLVVGNVITPQPNRRYKLTHWALGNLLVSGSGFATSDLWLSKFQVSVDSGAYVDVGSAWYVARAPVAQSFRYPVPVGIVDYLTGTATTLQFKVVAAKQSGASTVTSDYQTDNHLLVEDIGAV